MVFGGEHPHYPSLRSPPAPPFEGGERGGSSTYWRSALAAAGLWAPSMSRRWFFQVVHWRRPGHLVFAMPDAIACSVISQPSCWRICRVAIANAEFVSWISPSNGNGVTNTENQLAFAKAANVLPSTVKAVEDYRRELSSDAHPSPVEQGRNISATQLSQAEVLVPAMKNLKVLQKAIYENIQAAMLGEKTVDQAVADAASAWNNQS